MLESKIGIEQIADEFQLSSRQIRRIIQKEFGVSPIELILTRRLLLAKQLLTETLLPINQVARASGFASTRRFNDAFARRNGIPPTRLRKGACEPCSTSTCSTITLQLSYRPPLDWQGLMNFIAARTLGQVEHVQNLTYMRTINIGDHTGWISVSPHPTKSVINAEVSISLTPVLPILMRKLRHMFDLTARPDLITAHLASDARLASAVAANAGLRVPGTFDGFELAIRAILGQQITVKAATTLGCRFTSRFGDSIETPHAELTRLTPTQARIAAATIDEIASLGIIQARARSIIAIAQEMLSGRLKLNPGADPDMTVQQLIAIPGIGPWTAQYISMRALSWPDAFPKEDIALRKALGMATPSEAETISQPWRPWRSYATMHLWQKI
jgi:AraC family transcriptional regulator of adaptative response / DNA-3-methyladenine glycosylase II